MRADVLFLIRSAQRRRECDLKGVGDEGYLFVAGDKLCQKALQPVRGADFFFWRWHGY